MTYRLSENGVVRLADSAFVPNDIQSSDWQGYQAWLAAGNVPQPTPKPDIARLINIERDRRLMRFTFNGVAFDFDLTSRNRIETARNSAGWAIVAGKQPGDLRWADPNIDFGWIAADNSFVAMDAPTTLAFGNAAAAWEGRHIVAARFLKDMSPIPEAFSDDQYWPA